MGKYDKRNATQRNATLLVLCSILGCGDIADSELEQRQQSMVSKGTDPVVGLRDYNVEIAQRVPTLMSGLSTVKTTQAFAAMMAARTTGFQLNHNKNEAGQCPAESEFASSFSSGYTTIITAHHPTAVNSSEVLYRFMLPAPAEPRATTMDLTPISDRMVYDRLHRMGFDGLWNSDWETVERLISTWQVASKPVVDWHAKLGVDALVWKSRPKCLEVFGGSGDSVYAMGPGLFVDWLHPIVGDLQSTPVGIPLYAAHVNGFQHRSATLSDTVWKPPLIELFTLTTLDMWHLASFPGYRGNPTTCAPVKVGCANTVLTYKGCDESSLDLNNGSSGGAVHVVSSLHRAGAVGVVQGGYHANGNENFWGLLDDVATGGSNFDEMPSPQAHTLFTPFTKAMIPDFPINRGPAAQVEDGSPWVPNKDLWDIGTYSTCLGTDCLNGCLGNCSDPNSTRHELKCSDMYLADVASAGGAIGVTGGLRKTLVTVGDFGLVCGPLSAWSWTNFWDRVGYVTSNIDDLLYDADCTAGKCRIRPFSRALVTDWIDKFGEVDSRPFQLCPPGFMLRGLEVNFKQVLHGVTAVTCVNPAGNHYSINLEESAPGPHKYDISTWIGRPDPTLKNHEIECTGAAPVLTGMQVYRDPNDAIVGLQPLCSESPPPLSKSDECALPIPAGVTIHGEPQK